MQRRTHLIERVCGSLGARFAGFVPAVREHSPLPAVLEASHELLRLRADAVIAVGGGSAIVTARASSIPAAEGADVRSLCTVSDGKGGLKSPRLTAPKLPQFVVPTTPTTAMVKAGSAILEPQTGHRLALFDPQTRARAIFIDPEMLQSAPRSLVVSASLNAYAMSIEGLMSRFGNPVADALLMHALRVLDEAIDRSAVIDDLRMREDLATGAILCGQGTDLTGAGATTVLGHAIGVRHGVDNGIVNAILLPHVIRFNAEEASPGIRKIAASMSISGDDERLLLQEILVRTEELVGRLIGAKRLRDIGVPRESLRGIAEASINDWFLRNNPKPISTPVELSCLVERAW